MEINARMQSMYSTFNRIKMSTYKNLSLFRIVHIERCSNHITANISRGTNGIVALILARGGSKGIPYKNLAKIDGVSLLGNTLRIIHNCRWKFDEVWVSTDDNLIAREARRFNANVHYRSEYSARDEATSIESIQEFLNGHRHIQSIALIQCTSVFIRESYLEAAVEMFSQSHDIDCVFSVQRYVNVIEKSGEKELTQYFHLINTIFFHLFAWVEPGNCVGNKLQAIQVN